MLKFSRFYLLVFYLLLSADAVAGRLPATYSVGATRAPVQVNATSNRLNPVITGFASNTCAKAGARISLVGRNFGAKKMLFLIVGHSSIPINIISWTNTKIAAQLPTSGLKAGTWYFVGIKKLTHDDVWTNTWLSNINKKIHICGATNPRASLVRPPLNVNTGLAAPKPPIIRPMPIPPRVPDNSHVADVPAQQDDKATFDSVDTSSEIDENIIDSNDNNTQTVTSTGSGALINRQLPAPPRLSINASKNTSANAIAEPNELLVISQNMNEARQLAQQLRAYGLTAKKRKALKHLGLVLTTYRVPSDVDLQQTTLNIRQAYPKMWTDINHRYHLLNANRSTQVAKQLIHWEKNDKQCGKGLRIGLVDTAINTQHPALKSQNIISHSVLSQGINKAKKTHGTAIATLLVGSDSSELFSGMLPSAQLISAAVFRQRDKKNIDTTAEWIVSAIDWLLSKNVQVINMSIGGPRNLLVDVAIQRTLQAGVPVIAAAGNGGSTATAVYPAAQAGVIAVTAVDSNLKAYNKANIGKYIDFAAPGVDIWAGNEKGAGKFVTGTSFAVPFVTAAIASLVKKEGAKKAYAQLQKKAKDLGNKGKDPQFGWGFLQVESTCL